MMKYSNKILFDKQLSKLDMSKSTSLKEMMIMFMDTL